MHAMAILSTVAALLTAPFAPSQVPTPIPIPVPPPGEITINVVTVNGSGCPLGTTAVAVSPDKKAFTVTFSDFTAIVGPGEKPTSARKNCQLNLLVNVPQGFTYGIAEAIYRGYGELAKGATALEKANYYFQGNPQTESREHPFQGEFANNWITDDKTELAAVVYEPCGEVRNFNINTELRVGAGTSNPKTTTSFFTMDSADGAISTTYRFAWAICPHTATR
jgi:hypothetical protein